MCSEFKQCPHSGELITQYALNEQPPNAKIMPIHPTDHALIIGTDNLPMFLSWGFKVAWNKKPLINARSETLTKKDVSAILSAALRCPCYFLYRMKKRNW